MAVRISPAVIIIAALLLALAVAVGYGVGQSEGVAPAGAAQPAGNTWNSTMIWRPTLEEAGLAVAEWVNQIDARCDVDVDNVTAINGAGPEGDVYAFAVTWACR